MRKRERKEVVEGLLQQVNLWNVRKLKLGGFSGGMRQRFGIAQALIGSPRLVIVDEPTAGLDPEERNRFLNLLAEIGENVVVILSTHIVEDVTDLCPRMAIINQGQVLLTGEPLEAIRSLEGRVWRKVVSKDELPAVQARLTVLSTRLVGGRPLVHVLADACPEPGFERGRGRASKTSTSASSRAIAPRSRPDATRTMFSEFLKFDLRFQVRAPLLWIGIAVFALMAFGATSTDGVQIRRFDRQRASQRPVRDRAVAEHLHHPRLVASAALSSAARCCATSSMGTSELFFSKPIGARSYLLGRYVAGVLVSMRST